MKLSTANGFGSFAAVESSSKEMRVMVEIFATTKF